MARNKYPEITQQRILDTATKLFLEKGWEETTIQDIVDELGDMTRGAFYHHFKSKDDIIDAVTTGLFTQDSPIENPFNLEKLNGLEKLKKIFMLSLTNENQLQFVRAAPTVLQSPIFIGKQVKECVEVIAPKVCIYLEEGNSDGSLSIEHPKQTAETLILLANLWLNPMVFHIPKDEYLSKIKHLRALYEAVGVPLIDNEIESLYLKYYEFINAK